jgi:hypothetical protein
LNTSASDVSHQLSLLAEAGFRYIVIHKDLTRPEVADKWQAYLTVTPRYENEEVAVYATAPVAGQDYILERELMTGVGLIHTSLSRDERSLEPALSLQVVWGTTEPPEMDLQAEVSLLSENGAVKEVHDFDISPRWPPLVWSADAVVRDTYTVSIDPGLRDGRYRVAIGLIDKEDGQITGQRVDIGEVILGGSREGRSVFPIDQSVRVSFGDRLHLLGYGVQVENDRIRILLHWQASRPMNADYKFLVHLVDAETGRLVAQADVMPHGWTYPTSQWRAGEVVSDEVLLSVEDVPPGDYRLLVGVYSPESGERLPIPDGLSDFAVKFDRLELPTLIRR